MDTNLKKNTLSPRERILRTAHDLFYSHGIRATGIDRIIAEASVTKVTFYRNFPSKNDLIRAFLEFRHARWMGWFSNAVKRHGGDFNAVPPALEEWFLKPEFRGCAFLNSMSELGEEIPEIYEITRRHKTDMEAVITDLLPDVMEDLAQIIAVAIDGAIIRAQYDQTPESALRAIKVIIESTAARFKPVSGELLPEPKTRS